MSASQRSVFATAAARWSQIIVGDVPDVTTSQGPVDDLLIDASAPAIDGPGGTLGQAGPREIRSGSSLPAYGITQFDSADIAALDAAGRLVDVILHEMGHVIGIGTIWNLKGLLSGAGGATHGSPVPVRRPSTTRSSAPRLRRCQWRTPAVLALATATGASRSSATKAYPTYTCVLIRSRMAVVRTRMPRIQVQRRTECTQIRRHDSCRDAE
jgi:hypothetical protein